jgi:hypothetical protein
MSSWTHVSPGTIVTYYTQVGWSDIQNNLRSKHEKECKWACNMDLFEIKESQGSQSQYACYHVMVSSM